MSQLPKMTRAEAKAIMAREQARPDHMVARTCLAHEPWVKWEHARNEPSTCPACGR